MGAAEIESFLTDLASAVSSPFPQNRAKPFGEGFFLYQPLWTAIVVPTMKKQLIIIPLLTIFNLPNQSLAQQQGLDLSFPPPAINIPITAVVRSIVVHPDQRMTLAGESLTTDENLLYPGFTSLLRLKADDSRDSSFTPLPKSSASTLFERITCVALHSDGRLIVGSGNLLMRLNENGSRDTSYNSPLVSWKGVSGTVNCAAVNRQGNTLVGGFFDSINYDGVRNHLGRIATNGVPDFLFNSDTSLSSERNGVRQLQIGPNAPVYAIVIQSDGKSLVGGDFTSVNGQPRRYIARFNADGTFDPTFDAGPNFDIQVRAIAIQPDGRIIPAGISVCRCSGGIARLHINGSIDPTFNPGIGADGPILAIAIDADGGPVVGGGFTLFNNQPRSRLAKLKANGSLEEAFQGVVVNGPVYSIKVDAANRILVGGDFSAVGQVFRPGLARFHPKGLPPSLTLTQTPQGQIGVVGGSALFSVRADGVPPFRYQWQLNGKDISRETNANLSLRSLTFSTEGTYSVIVTDSGGTSKLVSAPLVIAKWSQQVGQNSGTPAIGADGSAYVISSDSFPIKKTLYAFDRSGVRKWTNAWTGLSGPNLDSLAVGPTGRIFTQISPRLTAFAATGAILWQTTNLMAISNAGSIAIDLGGNVIAGQIHSFDPAGKLKWNSAVQYGSDFSLSSDSIYATSTVYNDIYAFDFLGKQKWHIQLGSKIGASPSIGTDGRIYIPSQDGKMYCLAGDGAKQWDFRTAGPILASPAIASDGTIYFGSEDASFYAVSPNGTEKWKFPTRSKVISTPALLADGRILFISSNTLYFLSPDGTINQSLAFENSLQGSPSVGLDGTIYFSSFGKLIAIPGAVPLANGPWPMFRADAQHSGRVVSAAPSQIKAVGFNSRGNFTAEAIAEPGHSLSLWASTNLINWRQISSSIQASNPSILLLDTESVKFPLRFYRSRQD